MSVSLLSRTRNRALAAVGALLILLVLYVAVFSCWWMSAKRKPVFIKGQWHVEVQVHQSSLMYYTQPVWKPAFWFVEHVGGYQYAGYTAAMEDSAFVFEK